jgi:SEC-C motif domain protein
MEPLKSVPFDPDATFETEPCPCGTGQAYISCCGRYLERGEFPDTAERLMRSRYTAFVHNREDYLLASWHASTRPNELTLHIAPPTQWLGLKVLRSERGGEHDSEGVVEFVARFKVNGRAERLHETSRFVREGGLWFYLDGMVTS